MIKASLLSRAGMTVAAVVLLPIAPALAADAGGAASAHANGGSAARGGESTPVDLTGASADGAAHVGGGGSIVRTIVGLAIVIGVIYGVAWVLRQVKAGKQERATGAGLASLASVPLGSGRSVHLVRAGNDLVLLGVAEHGVVPIRTYSEDEARAAGLVDDDGMVILPVESHAGNGGNSGNGERKRFALPSAPKPAAKRLASPRPKLALPAPRGALDTLRSWTVRG